MSPHKYFRKIKTSPDGNCAFNAFALGLRDLLRVGMELNEVVTNKFLHEFNRKNTAYAQADWLDLKQYLLSLQTPELQQQLAPVLRELACDLVFVDEQETDGKSESTLKQSFISAFFHAFEAEIGLKVDKLPDDIFCQHFIINDFFQKKIVDLKAQYKNWINSKRDQNSNPFSLRCCFQFCGAKNSQIRAEYLKEKANDSQCDHETELLIPIKEQILLEINTAWYETYRTIFFAEMKKDKKWAGDMELGALAKFFGVNLGVFSKGWKYLVDDQIFKNEMAPTLLLKHHKNHYSYYQPNEDAYLSRIKELRDFIEQQTSSLETDNTEIDELNYLSARRDPKYRLFSPQ
ncbi:MAG: hypothetical protein ACHP9Y_04935 [Gammaproteobacteria bacterium]